MVPEVLIFLSVPVGSAAMRAVLLKAAVRVTPRIAGKARIKSSS
jgi:hypothetical protein